MVEVRPPVFKNSISRLIINYSSGTNIPFLILGGPHFLFLFLCFTLYTLVPGFILVQVQTFYLVSYENVLIFFIIFNDVSVVITNKIII